jgi:hypothetical protein
VLKGVNEQHAHKDQESGGRWGTKVPTWLDSKSTAWGVMGHTHAA